MSTITWRYLRRSTCDRTSVLLRHPPAGGRLLPVAQPLAFEALAEYSGPQRPQNNAKITTIPFRRNLLKKKREHYIIFDSSHICEKYTNFLNLIIIALYSLSFAKSHSPSASHSSTRRRRNYTLHPTRPPSFSLLSQQLGCECAFLLHPLRVIARHLVSADAGRQSGIRRKTSMARSNFGIIESADLHIK